MLTGVNVHAGLLLCGPTGISMGMCAQGGDVHHIQQGI
jgi:hypothetical protein